MRPPHQPQPAFAATTASVPANARRECPRKVNERSDAGMHVLLGACVVALELAHDLSEDPR